MEEMPNARSLAIRVRSVGIGACEGSSSRQPRKLGVTRPCGEEVARPNAVSSRCSATAVISGDAQA